MIEKTIHEDEALTQAMKDYGYTWDGMLPLNASDAATLLEGGVPVYLLHPDATEAEALRAEDISAHAAEGGLFGVEKNDLTQKEIYVPIKGKDELSLDRKRDLVSLAVQSHEGFEDLNYEENEQYFFDQHFPNDPHGAVVATTYGDYNYMDPYVRVDERGNLQSLTSSELNKEIDRQFDELAKVYAKYVSAGMKDYHKICEKRKCFVVKLNDPVKESSRGIHATIEANKEKAATKEPTKPSKEHSISDDR